jgi:hypothetical protein
MEEDVAFAADKSEGAKVGIRPTPTPAPPNYELVLLRVIVQN